MSQNSKNTFFADHAQPRADRARGGTLVIDIIIPSEKVGTSGAKRWGLFTRAGSVTTRKLTARTIIDFEKLPLVNVAGYAYGEEQTGDDELKYHPDKLTFTFSTERPKD